MASPTQTRKNANKKSKPRRSKSNGKKIKTLNLPAIEVLQGNRKLYSFAVDGKLLHDFCTISRVSRHDGEDLSGYQRPEVVSHIGQIRDYLESENPVLPNAIVVAFNDKVSFKPSNWQRQSQDGLQSSRCASNPNRRRHP